MSLSCRQYSSVRSLQPKVVAELEAFVRLFPDALGKQAIEVLLIGSCSRGEATYRSDIDLLIVLRNGPLNYQRVRELRDLLDRETLDRIGEPVLPFQVNFVLSSVRQSREPAIADALRCSVSLLRFPTQEAA